MAVPKIRFPGFTDAWEQRKLGDVLEITTRLNNDNEYGKQDVLSVSDEYGLINQIKFQGRSFAANDVSGYKKVQPDDIVYTRSPLALKPYGIIKKSFSEAGIISPLYIVNTAKKGNDSTFLYYTFDSPEKTNNYLKPLVRMGAKHTMNISNDEWLSGEIWLASEEEQKKIGKFFRLFDNALTLHQRKLESIKLLKKSLLQKMFPKSGESVPEVRFPGFTDAWEQRKLGDVLEITTRLNNDNEYGKQDVLSVSDEYGLINQIKFQGRSFAANDVSGYKKVQPDDIVYTRSPLALKPYGIIKKSFSEAGIISPLYIVNTAKKGNDSTFLYYTFDSPEKTNNYLKPLVRMGAKHTMNISNDEWLSGEIWLASEEEQKKIGKFFRLFDNALTLHQRKVESLQKLKKSLLQQMFV